MQVNNTEINGFLIDQFNQHNLDVGKAQGICPLCSLKENLKIENKMCLVTIGNEVWVLVITVIQHFNYIHINVKGLP
jgi:hypothetical protein